MSSKIKEIHFNYNKITPSSKSFIIAELSCNHIGNLDIAKKTIEAMGEAGADCVKLQTFKPERITLNSRKDDFVIKKGLWKDRDLYGLYKETYTPWEWHGELMKMTLDLGMDFFSSPFDLEAIDFLDALNVPAYKLASFEITDVELIEAIAKKGKPVIFSTGIATMDDIDLAVSICDKYSTPYAILKCTSSYPTPLSEVNLNNMKEISKKYNCLVGVSDHTEGSIVPISSTILGGKIIEKHFILDKSIKSHDAAFSMDPSEFKKMVSDVRNAEEILGNGSFHLTDLKKESRNFGRSLYFSKDLKKGEVITENNIQSVRPGFGAPVKDKHLYLGKTVLKDVSAGDRVSLSLVVEDL